MTRILYRRNRKTTFTRVLSAVLVIVFTLSFTGVVHAVAPDGTKDAPLQVAPVETVSEEVVAPEPEPEATPEPEAQPKEEPKVEPKAVAPAPEAPVSSKDKPAEEDSDDVGDSDDEPGKKDDTPPQDAGGYTTTSGNPAMCADGLKLDPARSGTFTHMVGDVLVTVTLQITQTEDGELLSWTSDFPVNRVIVKGGPNANIYTYAGATSGSMLHAPLNPSNKWADASWVGFCFAGGGGGGGGATSVIRAYKFNDLNGDGNQDEGEGPLAGFTFDLLRGDTVLDSATTDSSGFAEFDPVTAGTYVAREQQRANWEVTTPGGYTQTVEITQGAATVTFGNRLMDVDVPEWTKTFRLTVDGEIANTVEGYGVEYVIDGVSTRLALTAQGGGVFSADVTLADDTVIEAWMFYAVVDGSRVRLSVTHGPETITEDTLNSHMFAPGAVSGTKFIDADMDGAGPYDVDDTFGAGWTFVLEGPGLGDGVTAMSAGNGMYVFDGLLPGHYTVSEVSMPGFQQIHPAGPMEVYVGMDGMARVVNFVNRPVITPRPPVEKRFRLVTEAALTPAPSAIQVDYVIDGQTTTVTLANQGGGVWLSGPQMLEWGTTISAWSVHAVVDGSRWPTPLFSSMTPETLQPAGTDPVVNTATFAPGAITGVKAIDTDRDGVADDTAPAGMLAGWSFTLNGDLATEVSANDGSFSFDGLLPGTYVVAEDMTAVQEALFGLVLPVGGVQTMMVAAGQTAMLQPFLNQPVASSISLEKSASPGAGVPGSTITYTFTISNTGPWALSDVTVSDPLLPALAEQVIPTLAPAGQPGDSFTFTADFVIPAGTAPGPLTNTAEASGTDVFGDVVTDTASAVVAVGAGGVPAGPLTITKTASVAQVAPGGTVVYTVTYRNTGDAPIEQDFTIVDDFPENLVTIVDAGGGMVADGTITWAVSETLDPGESGTLRYTVRADSDLANGTVIDNVVTIAAFNAVDTARVTVRDVDAVVDVDQGAVVGEAFLPFTGGNALAILFTALAALGVGLTARRFGRAVS